MSDTTTEATGIVYLATPYTSKSVAVRARRFRVVCRVAAKLIRDGVLVYSPISHSHSIALAGGLPTDFAYWERSDRAMLGMCVKLIVVQQEGWELSEGVTREIEIATALDLPIEFLDPHETMGHHR